MSKIFPNQAMDSLCDIFGHSRQAYYKSLGRGVIRAEAHGTVLDFVRRIREEQPRIGTQKLHYLLERDNIAIGRDKLYQLLRLNGMLVKQRKRYRPKLTDGNGESIYIDYRKSLVVKDINQLWCCDITYIELQDEARFCYATFVTDEKSHRIVGQSVTESMSTEAIMAAVKEAVAQEGKACGNHFSFNLYLHTDRGGQFKSLLYRKFLNDHGIIPSMTAAGKSSENPVSERLNGIIKNEILIDSDYKNWEVAAREIKRAVMIYNDKRPHLSNGMLTPTEAHKPESGPLKRLWKQRKKKPNAT